MISKNTPILEIQGLKASINDNSVIKDLNLTVNAGEIHAIMGKNGSGKSTFSKIVAASASWGIALGETKDETSILGKPASIKLSGLV